MPFLIIFIVIPFTEIAIFAAVSNHIGIWTTLSLAFLTAVIGGLLVKHQGLQTFFSMRENTQRGEMPLNEIFDGFCIIAAGALLITPGFLTDVIGFSLLIPHLRGLLKTTLKSHTKWTFTDFETQQRPRNPEDPTIIEGEFEEINDTHDKLK